MLLQEDFQLIYDDYQYIEKIYNKTVLITGATGLIGSLLARFFIFLNKEYKANIHIMGIARSQEKVRAIYGERVELVDWLWMDLVNPKERLPEEIDYIIHCAAITQSIVMQQRPVDVINLTLNSTLYFLDYLKTHIQTKLVYISSMEMYGSIENGGGLVDEETLGYINILSPRASYPESKRMAEALCSAYTHQYHCRTNIARLAQTFGAGILPGEGRAFYQFAKSVMTGKDIILKTLGNSEGNYVYTGDAIAGILRILLEGTNGSAYNVVNEASHTTIKRMAQMVIDHFGNGQSKLIFDISDNFLELGYMDGIKLHLSSQKLQSLNWVPKRDLKDSYQRMILYMKENNL